MTVKSSKNFIHEIFFQLYILFCFCFCFAYGYNRALYGAGPDYRGSFEIGPIISSCNRKWANLSLKEQCLGNQTFKEMIFFIEIVHIDPSFFFCLFSMSIEFFPCILM